jgi:acetylornithine deacetylase/succinyl-diaminopimelate desuccinylase-like protein
MKTTLPMIERILDLACAIQQVPAPTFQESKRAAFLLEIFQQAGLSSAGVDPAGNVLACLPGVGKAAPVVVTAHLDTIFPIETPLTIERSKDRIQGPGIGDNSLGLAALPGLAWIHRDLGISLPGDIWLAATVGEEGLGNLKGMQALVDRFSTGSFADCQPKAYIVLEGMGLGEIFHRGLGVRRYRISCDTPGGHSWIDYGKPSAVHSMASLITRLTELSIPRNPRTSLNVGVIRGGTSINTIASHSEIELDLRSETPATLNRLAQQVEGMVRTNSRTSIQYSIEEIGNRPPGEIPASHPLVEMARAILSSLDLLPNAGIGSTDANIPLSRGLPAICLGLTRGGGAHTLQEYIQTRPLLFGMETLVQLVGRIYSSRLL